MSGETLYVYGAAWCPFCVKARTLLQRAQRQGWRTMYIDIDTRASASKAAAQASHRAQLDRIETIPAVFVGATYLGGSDRLAELLASSNRGAASAPKRSALKSASPKSRRASRKRASPKFRHAPSGVVSGARPGQARRQRRPQVSRAPNMSLPAALAALERTANKRVSDQIRGGGPDEVQAAKKEIWDAAQQGDARAAVAALLNPIFEEEMDPASRLAITDRALLVAAVNDHAGVVASLLGAKAVGLERRVAWGGDGIFGVELFVKAGSTGSLRNLLAVADQRAGPGSVLQDAAHIVAPSKALAAAVTCGDEDMVRLLLGAKADPDGTTHVIEAAKLVDATILRLLLQAKAQLRQARYPSEGTALSAAAYAGRASSVQVLLSAKAEPDAHVIASATTADNVDVMRALLAAKAQPDAHVFAQAAREGHVGMVHLLLAAKARPDMRVLSAGTPEARNVRIMRLLLAAKAQPDAFALGRAATAGHGDVMRLLLAAKAQPDVTALKRAATAGSATAVQVLLAAKADASGEDLVRGAAGSRSEDAVLAVDFLVHAKAPVHFNGAAHGALNESRQSDQSTARVLRLLLQLNADLGPHPDRLVEIGALHGKREAVEVLLQAKAPPDPPIGLFGKDVDSPLLTAVANRNAGIVELLVHAKADVHRLDVVGHYPPGKPKIKFVARPLDALILCGMDGSCSGNFNVASTNDAPIDKPDVIAKSIDMARTLLSAKTDVLDRCIEVQGETEKLTALELARRFGEGVPAALLRMLQQAQAQQFASGTGPAKPKPKNAKGAGARKRPR